MNTDNIDLIELLSNTTDPEQVHILIEYMAHLDRMGKLHIVQQKSDAEIMDNISNQIHQNIVAEYERLTNEKDERANYINNKIYENTETKQTKYTKNKNVINKIINLKKNQNLEINVKQLWLSTGIGIILSIAAIILS